MVFSHGTLQHHGTCEPWFFLTHAAKVPCRVSSAEKAQMLMPQEDMTMPQEDTPQEDIFTK